MSGQFIYADDLAKDLGYGGMTPAFWAWCKRAGLKPARGSSFAFDPREVGDALRRSPV